MKKTFTIIMTSLSLAAAVFAQEAAISFENTISSDVVSVSEGDSEFAGITEQITAEFESEKLDAGISLITEFNKNEDNHFGLTAYEIDTAYVEFKPVDILGIAFNREIFTAGSYLPVADDNVGNGNIGSDLSLILRPSENLSVAAGLKIPSVFADTEEKVDLDAGIDYTTDLFSVGATLRSPVNNLGFGVFGSYTGIDNLTLNLGFSYNDDFCDVAGNLLTLGAAYEVSIFTIGFDFVSNFGNDGNDLYTALALEAGITDNIIVETQAALNMDFEDSKATQVIAEVGGAYVIGDHKIRVGIAIDFSDSIGFSFPVYYKYSF